MYNGIQKIDEIINEIENNITSDIDYEALASKMTLSVYEFRRIFAFVVGTPISEYVRKRRLSLAACDLMTNPKANIQEISEKYGYSTLAAFSKAFSEYHGFPPTVCQRGNCEITLFSKPKFELRIQNVDEHSFWILSDTAFTIQGYCAFSEHTDTCCCEQVWNDFYNVGKDKELSEDKIFASYRNEQGMVKCCIGERVESAEATMDADIIPESRWLCVKMNTTDDDIVNQKYNALLCDLLPSTNMRRRPDMPTVEVYPRDMSEEGFEWEIRIPIE
jgi:AraC-like DNA-binding protein